MNWKAPHTYIRLGSFLVVCACAIYTTWWQTHPETHVKYKVIQVRQGDGYITESQCRSIKKNDKMSDLRQKFGFPAGKQSNFDWNWDFPLREDHSRECSVWYSEHFGPFKKGNRVDSVRLDLVSF